MCNLTLSRWRMIVVASSHKICHVSPFFMCICFSISLTLPSELPSIEFDLVKLERFYVCENSNFRVSFRVWYVKSSTERQRCLMSRIKCMLPRSNACALCFFFSIVKRRTWKMKWAIFFCLYYFYIENMFTLDGAYISIYPYINFRSCHIQILTICESNSAFSRLLIYTAHEASELATDNSLKALLEFHFMTRL